MLPWLMVLQALLTLWLTWCCWRYARQAAESNAALWRAMADGQKRRRALSEATSEAFDAVGEDMDEIMARLDEFDELELTTLTKPPNCGCKKCREQRARAVN